MSQQVSLPHQVVAALRQGLGEALVAVVLFGSRARGEADESSDWDLLVIARDLPPAAFPRHLFMKRLLPPSWRGRTTLLAKTPQEFEARLPALFFDIALDGIVLHDTDDYVGERLARLRQLIETHGLRRERDQDTLAWRWQHFPGFSWALEWESAQ